MLSLICWTVSSPILGNIPHMHQLTSIQLNTQKGTYAEIQNSCTVQPSSLKYSIPRILADLVSLDSRFYLLNLASLQGSPCVSPSCFHGFHVLLLPVSMSPSMASRPVSRGEFKVYLISFLSLKDLHIIADKQCLENHIFCLFLKIISDEGRFSPNLGWYRSPL